MGSIYKRKRRDGSLSPKWTIEYKLHDGRWKAETAYRDRRSSAQLLARREKEVAQRAEGLFDEVAEQGRRPLEEHVDEFFVHVKSRGTTEKHRKLLATRLGRALDAMDVSRLADMTADSAEKFLVGLVETHGVSAKTRDDYLSALRQFAEWLVDRERLHRNPFRSLRRLVTASTRDASRTFERGPFSEEELEVIVHAAMNRGVQRYAETHPNASEETLEGIRRKGCERGMLFLFAAFTGFRLSAARAVRWGDVDLNGEDPSVLASAKYAKNNRNTRVPLITWVARELREWRHTKSTWAGRPVSDGELVFDVAARVLKLLRADAEWAGLDLIDAMGRRRDFHSLRVTTATLCVRHKVHPRSAMQILQHRTIAQTMEVYAKLEAADLRGAVDQLPTIEGLRGVAAASVHVSGRSAPTAAELCRTVRRDAANQGAQPHAG